VFVASSKSLARTPNRDDLRLAADDNANNDFMFSGQTPSVKLADGTTAGAMVPTKGTTVTRPLAVVDLPDTDRERLHADLLAFIDA